jgi:Uma2 family endonuclease
MNAPISIPPRTADDELDWRDPTLWPEVNKLVTEDDTPVDNPYSEKQMRLLTEPLYSSWPGPGGGVPFRVLANVGLYQTEKNPLVPDVMLGMGVSTPEQLMVKGHRAWFIWIVGKTPDLALEIVSNKEGGEDTNKMAEYATIGIPYYVIHDPANILGSGVLRAFALHARKYVLIDPRWLADIGLGLVIWQGVFEDSEQRWLRWCDEKGVVIPTGLERAKAAEQRVDTAEQRADTAEQRAEQLAAKLRELGHDVPQ